MPDGQLASPNLFRRNLRLPASLSAVARLRSSQKRNVPLHGQEYRQPSAERPGVAHTDVASASEVSEINNGLPETTRKSAPRQIYATLEQGQSIVIGGIYNLVVLTGIVVTYGAIISSSPEAHRIYAPLTHAVAPCIAISATAKVLIESTSSDEEFPPPLNVAGAWDFLSIPGIKTQATMIMVCILPSVNSNAKIMQLRNGELGSEERTWTALETSSFDRVLEHFVISNSPTKRILVQGERKAGKSTFCAYFINRCLTDPRFSNTGLEKPEVCLLDLDIAQPLVRPPDIAYVAILRRMILGPAFTQQIPMIHDTGMEILHQRYVSRELMSYDLSQVVDVIEDLIDLVMKCNPKSTLIVNLASWMGDMFHTQSAHVERLGITNIVILGQESTSIRQNGALAIPAHRISRPSAQPPVSSSVLRALQTQATFHTVGFDSISGVRWLSLPLLYRSNRGLPTPYTGPCQIVTAIYTVAGQPLPTETLQYALQGSIVNVLLVESHHFYAATEGSDHVGHVERTPEDLPYLRPDDDSKFPFLAKYTSCLGLAYVREIAVLDGLLYLVPEIGMEHVDRKGCRTVLVLGSNDESWIHREVGGGLK